MMKFVFPLLLLDNLHYSFITNIKFSSFLRISHQNPCVNMPIVQAVTNVKWFVRRYHSQQLTCELSSVKTAVSTWQSQSGVWVMPSVHSFVLTERASAFKWDQAEVRRCQKEYNMLFLCLFCRCTICCLTTWLPESKAPFGLSTERDRKPRITENKIKKNV